MMSVLPLGGVATNTSAATESAVDAYANRILQSKSPIEAVVDTSLGPYVTAMLRCADLTKPDAVTEIPEFESLVELLEDQCSMGADDAKDSLLSIASAVCSGVVPNEHSTVGHNGNITVGPYDGSALDSLQVLGNALKEAQVNTRLQSGEVTQSQLDSYTPTSAGGPSPLKPDSLIPVDLLGVLDDPSPQFSTTQVTLEEQKEQPKTPTNDEEAFPPLGAQAPTSTKRSARGKKGPKSQSSNDIAAALFRPSRVRQNSIEKKDSPTLASQATHSVIDNGCNNQYYQQQLNSAVEILLSMSTDLGEEAAREAAMMASADFNVAQYIVDAAMTAPPVCRHMLHDGCYRSDCNFSHDVEGHTCMFWLRGRCGKGSSCKFLHGFNPKILNDINSMLYSEPNYYSGDQIDAYNNAQMTGAGYSNPYEFSQTATPQRIPTEQMPHSWEPPAGSSFSFANVATRGYDQTKFTSPALPDSTNGHQSWSTGVVPTVRIPQDLWNPNENRDASVFHIPDPLERYHAVASWVKRNDVIDLHYQSTKTFPTVLQVVLPKKLSEFIEIWVVTGTGHHVSDKTHQKGGGALEKAVISWLAEEGYSFSKGRDRNGMGGAVLVKR